MSGERIAALLHPSLAEKSQRPVCDPEEGRRQQRKRDSSKCPLANLQDAPARDGNIFPTMTIIAAARCGIADQSQHRPRTRAGSNPVNPHIVQKKQLVSRKDRRLASVLHKEGREEWKILVLTLPEQDDQIWNGNDAGEPAQRCGHRVFFPYRIRYHGSQAHRCTAGCRYWYRSRDRKLHRPETLSVANLEICPAPILKPCKHGDVF
ncbi:hypothetical protein [Paracoccus sp. TOH]|uniref:hypothetical protein n=1 Tax=Paracoccus sp. TOH TaxID=1263728 RepID=UPI0025B09CBE|nr:hypothetical protein [Paracoccus sp. TOH]WJS87125.1 hypothetical protein NBE95_21065 [Paracoccus sp. TOH]